MNIALTELRRGWRALLRRPAFLVLASASLALGIGAAVAAFALVDAVLPAPPPLFAQPDRLAVLGKGDAHPWPTMSPQQCQVLDGVAGIESRGAKFAPKDVNVAGSGDPELVAASPVDAGLVPRLGAGAARDARLPADAAERLADTPWHRAVAFARSSSTRT